MDSDRMETAMAAAEDVIIECSMDFPLAWGLGFLVDNQELIADRLADKPEIVKDLLRLVAEIEENVNDWHEYHGEDEEDEEDDE